MCLTERRIPGKLYCRHIDFAFSRELARHQLRSNKLLNVADRICLAQTMALYYSAGRTQTLSTSRSTSVARSTTDTSPSEDWERSFYIFPNPSSLPPTPYSQFSDLSAPSDVTTLDVLSPVENVIALNPSSTRRRPRETSPPVEPQDVDGVWDWPKEGAFASNSGHRPALHHSKLEKKDFMRCVLETSNFESFFILILSKFMILKLIILGHFDNY